MKNSYGFDTLSIHAGFTPDAQTHSGSPAIYQTTAYAFDSTEHAARLFELKEAGNIYTRLQNPTSDVFEQRMAALDGGVGALAFSSGHAAMVGAFLNLAEAGDEIVASIAIYGGAINMMGVTLGRLGIKVHFVDPDDLQAWENAINDRTKCLFTEVVGNPNANVADIPAIAEIAHRHGVPLIVDGTFVTPYLFKPIDFGADIVVYSATKLIGGHASSMGGVVVDSGKFRFLDNPRFPRYNEPDESYHGVVFAKDFAGSEFITRLRTLMMRDLGACPSPFNSFLFINGLETLSLRMRKHCDNAKAVAEFLSGHKKVKKVNYPTLPDSPYKALADKLLPRGAGAVFTIELDGDRRDGGNFIDSLQLFRNVANVGDVRSLVIHPASTTHSQLTAEQLRESGITEGTVRLSIGLEDAEDLIADLDQALNKAIR